MAINKENHIYLTQEGLDKLRQELEFLKTDKRIHIAERLKEAISYWDLSENSEYEDARNEQAQVEQRIKEIESELKIVKLVDESQDVNKIKMGSLVTLLDLSDEDAVEEQFKVIGTMEADILANPPKISNDSPVGKAVMGKKAGAVVKVKSLSGTNEFKIISFE